MNQMCNRHSQWRKFNKQPIASLYRSTPLYSLMGGFHSCNLPMYLSWTDTHIHGLIIMIARVGWSCFVHSSVVFSRGAELRGSSLEVVKVGCWCGRPGLHRCSGSRPGASRSELCRCLSPSALESAHTEAVPTVEEQDDQFFCAQRKVISLKTGECYVWMSGRDK